MQKNTKREEEEKREPRSCIPEKSKDHSVKGGVAGNHQGRGSWLGKSNVEKKKKKKKETKRFREKRGGKTEGEEGLMVIPPYGRRGFWGEIATKLSYPIRSPCQKWQGEPKDTEEQVKKKVIEIEGSFPVIKKRKKEKQRSKIKKKEGKKGRGLRYHGNWTEEAKQEEEGTDCDKVRMRSSLENSLEQAGQKGERVQQNGKTQKKKKKRSISKKEV